MEKDIKAKTRETADRYFKNVTGEIPFDLWKAFDKELAKELSLFITGRMYSREKIPHTVRQLVTISALTVLGQVDELRLHIQAALNVGCSPRDVAEVIFQTMTYGGVPAANSGFKVLKEVLMEKNLWPISES